jgi:uncharacterized protein (DUF2147 family)
MTQYTPQTPQTTPTRQSRITQRAACVLSLLTLSCAALAQMSPVGTWRNIDDQTKEAKSEVVITDNAGVLTGKISKLLRKDAKQDAKCSECTDDRKDKAVIGLDIIRGVKKTEGKDVWEGGTIIDPENGKSYKLKLTPIDGGKQLEVRGYIAFFSRAQTWVRVQ